MEISMRSIECERSLLTFSGDIALRALRCGYDPCRRATGNTGTRWLKRTFGKQNENANGVYTWSFTSRSRQVYAYTRAHLESCIPSIGRLIDLAIHSQMAPATPTPVRSVQSAIRNTIRFSDYSDVFDSPSAIRCEFSLFMYRPSRSSCLPARMYVEDARA
jgi:hypothetical protein